MSESVSIFVWLWDVMENFWNTFGGGDNDPRSI
jgi:hypothetical protein